MSKCFRVAALVLATASFITAQIPTSGLVGHYPFSGNADDSSGNGNNGTVSGATLTTDRFRYANRAYSFNGASNYIDLDSLFTIGTSPFAVSLWVKPASQGTLLSKGNWVDFEMRVYLENKINVILNGSAETNPQSFWSNSALAIGGWYHIVFVRDISNLTIYINGQLDSKAPYSPCNVAGTHSFRIGSRSWDALNGFQFFSGVIDDVRIYNRAISSNDVAALFYEGLRVPISIDKTGITGTPASFSVDSIHTTVSETFNTSSFAAIDSLYLCYEMANITYLTHRMDKPASYSVHIGSAMADSGNTVSNGTFLAKSINITALKALSSNFQVAFSQTGGGGEIIFIDPYLLVYGSKTTPGAIQKAVVRPESFLKAAAFPNPTHSATAITYEVSTASTVDISIFNADGKIVKNVFSGAKQAGRYSYVWDGTGLSGTGVANGNYFFRIRSESGPQILEKIIVLK